MPEVHQRKSAVVAASLSPSRQWVMASNVSRDGERNRVIRLACRASCRPSRPQRVSSQRWNHSNLSALSMTASEAHS